MSNERDIEFTPSPTLGTPQLDFTPDPALASPSTGSFDRSEERGPVAQAKEKAQQLVSSAGQRAAEQVTSRLDAQKERAADSLTEVAESLRNSSRQFQGDQNGLGRYINQAADRVEDIAHYLQDREVADIMDQVEDFARRQPAAFLGGAFALGLLGARFLKSSRDNLTHDGMRTRGKYETRGASTYRVEDPERDAVGRPQAPGYAPPSQRGTTDYEAAGPRQ